MKTIFLSLVLFVVGISAGNAQSERIYFEDLTKLLSDKCMQANLTRMTLRQNPGKLPYTYTSHGNGTLSNTSVRGNKITCEFRNVAFSDRSYFQGAKAHVNVVLRYDASSRKVQADVYSVTYGNTRLPLTDVEFKRTRRGYVLTGMRSSGRQDEFYTFAFYAPDGCLI